MIKLIVLDMDGTLLRNDKTISDATKSIIYTIKSMGIKVTIASGRAEPLIYPYAKMLEVDEYVLINNGTTIKNLHSSKVLSNHTINQDTKNTIMDTVLQNNLAFTLNANGIFYTNSLARKSFYERWNAANPDSLIHYEFVADFMALKPLKAEKILLIIDDESEIDHYETYFKDYTDIHSTKSQNNFLDIMPKSVNKGSALKILAESSQLLKEEIMVFGDHDNDAEMLAYAGIGVAMPNGSLKAKNSASFLALDTNNNDGVRKTLEHFLHEGILRKLNP